MERIIRKLYNLFFSIFQYGSYACTYKCIHSVIISKIFSSMKRWSGTARFNDSYECQTMHMFETPSSLIELLKLLCCAEKSCNCPNHELRSPNVIPTWNCWWYPTWRAKKNDEKWFDRSIKICLIFSNLIKLDFMIWYHFYIREFSLNIDTMWIIAIINPSLLFFEKIYNNCFEEYYPNINVYISINKIRINKSVGLLIPISWHIRFFIDVSIEDRMIWKIN